MCGICGYLVRDGKKPPEPGTLERMTELLAHRGPDDAGTWYHAGLGFGHRRLSIIDLTAAGHQPMIVPGLPYAVVYNGEIYNFQELRGLLEEKGRTFRTRSDTEVLLHAYDEWGPACLERFNGMFAFALYHMESGDLFLARDRLGVKPLYYFAGDGHFVFASEMKSILLYPTLRPELDPGAVSQYFAYKYVRAPATIFAGVRKLLPGHYLRLASGQPSVVRYWDPYAVLQSPLPPAPDERYQEQLDELLMSAAHYRIISDVPVGALLSGGIDSSLVVSAMKRVTQEVRTFTIGFTDREFDESPYARQVARALGTTHTEEVLTHAEVLEGLRTIPDMFDEPFADPSSIPTFLVSRLARRHVTVVLSGDAGDELFWGYSRYRKYRRALPFLAIPGRLRSPLAAVAASLPMDLLQKAARSMHSGSPEEVYAYLNGIFKGRDLSALLTDDLPPAPPLAEDGRLAGVDVLMRPSMIDLESYLPDDILTKVDRTSMAVSLEARSPFLDYRIVEFALRLPFEQKFRNGRQKWILRELLARHIPRQWIERRKQGFDLPLNSWFRNELREELLDRLAPARVERYGFIRADFVREIIQKHLSGRYDYYYMLWALLCFDRWYERHMESGRPS